jgi:alpha-tubulin suppressor-like RCC1 family protein
MRGRSRALAAVCLAACGGDDAVADGDDSGSSSASESSPTSSDDGPDPSSSSDDEAPDPDESSSDGTTGGGPTIEPEPLAPGLSAGHSHTCSVADGALTCWGTNGCGQLGDGTDYAKPLATLAPDRTWAAVATGRTHSCAIDTGGGLWCWGRGSQGQIGDGRMDELPGGDACRLEPFAILEGSTWLRVAPGDEHTCAVRSDGTLWCWGLNESGQIGDGAVGPLYTRLDPTEVGGDDWIDVHAAIDRSCGIRSDGSLWCWGIGGALPGTGLDFSSTPVELDAPRQMRAFARGGWAEHACAIDVDGGLWCWGSNVWGQLGPGDTTDLLVEVDLGGAVEAAATGFGTVCGRLDDGSVQCMGLGSSGQLGDGGSGQGHMSSSPVEVSLPGSAIAIAQGASHGCARTEDGVDLCWGSNDAGEIGDGTSGPDNGRLQPAATNTWGGGPIAGGWIELDVGGGQGCGTRNGGELWCWGRRIALGNGDTGEDCSASNPPACVVTTPKPVTAQGSWSSPAAGDLFTCAIRDDGTLWCWGVNDFGQLGNAGDDAPLPVQVEASADWLAVAAGGGTVCGIRSPGTLWCWGRNHVGQLGTGATGDDSPVPAQVGGDADWIDVVVSYGTACGRRVGGSLSCWGANSVGQLGQGVAGDPIATPSLVAGTWATVAVAPSRTCAIADEGTLWCWGENANGVVDPGGDELVSSPVQIGADTDWIAVALGDTMACATKTDGTAWCWGSNDYGQVGNGAIERDTVVTSPSLVVGVDDVVAVAAAGFTVCGVRSDGTSLCWGSNGGVQGNDTIFISGSPKEVRDDG